MEGSSSNVRIADLPAGQRPRERLARLGCSSLSDQELLALVLRTGGRGTNAVDLGQRLLARWGSLDQMAVARVDDLLRQSELGEAKAAAVAAAFELGRRAASAGPRPEMITGPEDIASLVCFELCGRDQEEVLVVVTNNANRVVRVVTLSRGGSDRCLLVPRDVLATVLRTGGTGFALAHNHPSGDPTPSREDVAVTKQVECAATAVGLRFLDHIIVAGPGEWSRVTEA